ncbi:hypothetical protein CISG_09783 [Coccidioides immitis RMSCC 3703]|uniref:RlpA-like protein double-psi beta-barrel domain-containing protein n=2 Tax=Coccidioides immitis TaxID=5501 RepID=A0A0J8TG40_COCIT|nr:hypothetical protein CIRG_06849 [Coccidioides immitis RMSCC 2394]KMU72592.1 hypothetical protein CISG_09783 [Coccidioides immitis RMSCC 3703]
MLFVRAFIFLFCALIGVTLAAPAPQPDSQSELQARDQKQVYSPCIETAPTGAGTLTASPGSQLGASGSCGRKLGDDAMIVALSNAWMKGQPNAPLCGRKVKATNKKNGKTVVVTVADTCAGCGANDLDFSVGAWNALTDNAPWGTFPAAWRLFTPSRAQLRSHSTA